MRQIHHWAALVFLGAIVAHLGRIFFTGAFRRPRELNWIVGTTLLVLAMANGFAGYSLLDDLLSGTGLRIAFSIVQSIPFVGNWAAFLLFGGEFPGDQLIPRLFVIHTLLLPAAIVGLISVHLAMIWHQKHTQFPGPGRTEGNVVGSRLWPTYMAKSVALFLGCFSVLAALGGLVQINPIWLYGPYKPAAVTAASQPDWYVGWLEGALRLMPPFEIRLAGFELPNPFFPGVLLPGVTFLLLYSWPFIERRITGDRAEHHLLDRPRDRPLRTAIGVAAFAFYAVLFFAGGTDVLAAVFDLSINREIWVGRGLLLVLPPLVAVFTYRLCRELGAPSPSGAAGSSGSGDAGPSATGGDGVEAPAGDAVSVTGT